MSEVKWSKDSYAEAKMREFGCQWTLQDVPKSAIDFEESRANCARLTDPINDDVATEYAVAMQNGAEFPKIILLSRRNKKFIIISGNHRYYAADTLDCASFPSYVVESSDASACDVLPRILNRGHGLRQSREEAIEHAIYAVKTYGFSYQQAEKMFGLRSKIVLEEIKIRQLREELQSKGVPTNKMAKQILKKLHTINNDNVRVSAAAFIAKSDMNVENSEDFINEIRKNRTEATQMSVVGDYEKKMNLVDPGPVVSHKRPVRTKFLTCIKTLENYLDGRTNLNQFQITESHEQQEIKKRIEAIIKSFQSLFSGRGKKDGKGSHQRRAS